jgi:hypothetical protein
MVCLWYGQPMTLSDPQPSWSDRPQTTPKPPQKTRYEPLRSLASPPDDPQAHRFTKQTPYRTPPPAFSQGAHPPPAFSQGAHVP